MKHWIAAAGMALALPLSWNAHAAGVAAPPDLPATAIVSCGPFAFTRNPLYLSLLTMFAGTGIALASPAFLLVIVPFFLVLHFGVVRRAER